MARSIAQKHASHPVAIAFERSPLDGMGFEKSTRLDQLGVERDFGVVGEELRDRAAGLGIGSSLVEDFLGGAGDAGGRG